MNYVQDGCSVIFILSYLFIFALFKFVLGFFLIVFVNFFFIVIDFFVFLVIVLAYQNNCQWGHIIMVPRH
jgi:hypothetical protein